MKVKDAPKRVKKHVRDNKELYIAVTLAAVAGGAFGYLVRGQMPSEIEIANKISNNGVNYKSTVNQTIVNVTRAAKGPLGNAIVRLSDGEQYRSQREAALKNGLSEYEVRSKIRDNDMFRVLREAQWAE
jgi:Na+-transporting NADH:ubiquinone oxidoreductase subunit NqrA